MLFYRFVRLGFFSLTVYVMAWKGYQVQAQPAGYYEGTSGLTGTELKTALHQIIRDHQPRSYAQLWQDFYHTDRKANDKVWDMYSDIPSGSPAYEYSFFTDQCGNYSAEGDCYNREHTWPASWFNKQDPMYTDLFHIVPVDGYVNNKRANYPYGEVGQANWVSTNGSMLGQSITANYTGIVFEPIDEYKGDLARGMMYMSVRYFNEDANWTGSPMTDGAELLPWAIELMLKWHEQDPVSTKELQRNETVYSIQQNRNPFIDHPEFAALIWDPASSLNEKTALKRFVRISPNPVTADKVSVHCVHCRTETYSITITDLTGKKHFTSVRYSSDNRFELAVGELSPGFYLLSITNGQQHTLYSKLIKN